MKTIVDIISRFWQKLVEPHHSIEDEVQRLKSRLLNITLIVLFLFGIAVMGGLFLFMPHLRGYPGMQAAFAILFLFPILLVVNKKGHFQITAVLLVALITVATFAANFTPDSAAEPAALVVLPIFTAAYFLPLRTVPIFTLLQVGLVGALLLWAPGLEFPEYLYAFVTILFLDLVINLYVFYQLGVERLRQTILVQNEKKYSEDLEKKVEERTRLLVAKTKELESFSYSVSHDLRAPLRHIAGYGQILEEDHAAKLDPEGKNYLERIIKSTQRMNELIDDLLLLSKISQKEMGREPVNASVMVKEILKEHMQADPARIIEQRIAPDIIIQTDNNLFHILLENLISNAWKFTAKRNPAVIEFGEIREGTRSVYFFKDNGVGFDQSLSESIFHPFQRLHEEQGFEGTGIGLAIVKRIVDMCAGKIWVESEIGRGTTFYFSLQDNTKP